MLLGHAIFDPLERGPQCRRPASHRFAGANYEDGSATRWTWAVEPLTACGRQKEHAQEHHGVVRPHPACVIGEDEREVERRRRARRHTFSLAHVGNRAGLGVPHDWSMSTQEQTVSVPAVEDVTSEFIATLALIAHAHLEPSETGKEPDLTTACVAIDTAGAAFERIASRLKSEQRAALSGILTDIRMTYVRKRGS
ncbi:MAG: DUF1844 domain-containing protein [Candidatus Eremiobacteraeota bacterium]|nr:DUF1844 domain-containing protein [Candidatus Eremiobacteraeota bacterium]